MNCPGIGTCCRWVPSISFVYNQVLHQFCCHSEQQTHPGMSFDRPWRSGNPPQLSMGTLPPWCRHYQSPPTDGCVLVLKRLHRGSLKIPLSATGTKNGGIRTP